MSREFTREAVMKFLPAPFSWIWCKCLLRNLIHSKIFNLTKYREVLVKYSLLITHAEMPLWIWHQLRERLTDSIFQIINSVIESWGVSLTYLDCNLYNTDLFTTSIFAPQCSKAMTSQKYNFGNYWICWDILKEQHLAFWPNNSIVGQIVSTRRF